MSHLDHSPVLSLAAVGLWHVLTSRFGSWVSARDLLLAQPNAMAWHPRAPLEDLQAALDELLAIGAVEHHENGYNLNPGADHE